MSGLTAQRALTGFITGGDTRLEAKLTLEDGRVRLFAGVYELGDWPIAVCEVTQVGHDRFLIEAEGETLTFVAYEPEAVLARIDPSGNGSASKETAPEPGGGTSASQILTPDSQPSDPALIAANRKPTRNVSKSKRTTTRARPRKPAALVAISENGSDTAPATSSVQPQAVDFMFGGPAQSEGQIPDINLKRKASVKKTPVHSALITEPAAAPTAPDPAEVTVEAVAAENTAGRETVAERVVRGVGRHRKARQFLPDDWGQFAMLATGGLMAVAALVGFAWSINSLAGAPAASQQSTVSQESPISTAPAATLPLSPVTTATMTTPATTDATTDTTAFPTRMGFLTATAVQFTNNWNDLALPVDESLALPAVVPEPFRVDLAPHIIFTGTADSLSGLMQSLNLVTYPQGEPEADRQIMTALGLAIGASEPSFDGSERRALLNALGLDLANPLLEGLDGTVVYGGVSYHLKYVPETVALEMTISSKSSTVQG